MKTSGNVRRGIDMARNVLIAAVMSVLAVFTSGHDARAHALKNSQLPPMAKKENNKPFILMPCNSAKSIRTSQEQAVPRYCVSWHGAKGRKIGIVVRRGGGDVRETVIK